MTVFQWAVMEANLDPVAGAEQKGTRPVLIASNEVWGATFDSTGRIYSRDSRHWAFYECF